jgi:hypothetical protein
VARSQNFKQLHPPPTQLRDPAALCARVVQYHLPSEIRGRRECRAPGAPAASRVEKNTRVSHHGHAGFTRHSPRNGFNGFLRALPGDRALLPPSSAENSANLTPASGRQDHTTSPSASSAVRPSAPSASTASRLTSVTIAKRPSGRRDGGGYSFDLGQAGTGIFLRMGLDRWNRIDPVQQIRFFKTPGLPHMGKARCYKETAFQRRLFNSTVPTRV